MKTTVKHLYRSTLSLSVLGALMLGGCAPYMEAPATLPQVPQAQVPQAAPLQQPSYQPAQPYPGQQRPSYQPPPRQYQAPAPQARYVDVPPSLDPVEERQVAAVTAPIPAQPQVVYEYRAPVRKSARPAKSSKPSVTYVPDAPKASVSARKETPPVSVASRSRSAQSEPVKPEPAKRESIKRESAKKESSSRQETAKAPASKPATKPFWDQGKVEVEVLDMQKTSRPSAAKERSSSSDSGSGSSLSSSNSSPAVIVLMKQANNDLVAGKSDRAAATLERALRISPDDAGLWLRLAEVNAQQGNKKQAATMARKAMTLAPGDSNIARRSQRLLN